jgi:hypothetical protein
MKEGLGKGFFLVGMILLLMFAIGMVSAADYYVNVTGSGIDCTLLNPCNLSYVQGNVVPGSKVYLAEGNYSESLYPVIYGNYTHNITFTALSNQQVNISYINLDQTKYVHIINLSAKKLGQYGINWTFEKHYPVGTFVNEDFWVAGSVNITEVNPSTAVFTAVERGMSNSGYLWYNDSEGFWCISQLLGNVTNYHWRRYDTNPEGIYGWWANSTWNRSDRHDRDVLIQNQSQSFSNHDQSGDYEGDIYLAQGSDLSSWDTGVYVLSGQQYGSNLYYEKGYILHGSMINPNGSYQSFDSYSDSFTFESLLEFPYNFSGNTSLVSVISHESAGDVIDLIGFTSSWGHSVTRTAAVLTILDNPIYEEYFRPPYFGDEKPLYLKSQINWSIFPRLNVPNSSDSYDFEDIYPTRNSSAGTVADQFSRYVQRPWILQVFDAGGRNNHPSQNMPNYHSQVWRTLQNVVMLLTLDLDAKYNTQGELEQLAIPVIQLGIDSYYANADSAFSKLPVMVAGSAFNEETMLYANNSLDRPDWMCYYRNQSASTLVSSIVSSDQFYHGYDVGWRQEIGNGEHEHLDPNEPNWLLAGSAPGGSEREAYRQINSPGFIGYSLTLRLFNLVEHRNNSALFKYADRYMEGEGKSSASGFIDAMWDEYRGDACYDGVCAGAEDCDYDCGAISFPSLYILYPLNTIYYSNITSINYTVINGESCWYSTNGGITNSSPIAAGTNWTGLNLGSSAVTVYCNSSDGSVNSSSVGFNVVRKRTFYWTMESEIPDEFPVGSDSSLRWGKNNNFSSDHRYQGERSLNISGGSYGLVMFDNPTSEDVWASPEEGTVRLYFRYSDQLQPGDADGNPLGMLFQITGKDITGQNDTNDGLKVMYTASTGRWSINYYFNGGSSNIYARSNSIQTEPDKWIFMQAKWRTSSAPYLSLTINNTTITTNTPFGNVNCSTWHHLLIGNDLATIPTGLWIDNFEVYDYWVDGVYPTINVLYALNTTYSSNITAINYTVINGESCWYSTNGGITNSSSVAAGTNWTGLNLGSSTLSVYCNSSDGSVNSSSVSFTVNGPAVPSVNIISPQNTTYSSNITAINYTVINGEYCWYSTDSGSTNSSAITAGTNWTGLNLGSSTLIVYCNSSDGSVNLSSVVYTVVNDATAPTTSIIANAGGTYGQTIRWATQNTTLSFSCSDDNSCDDTYYCVDTANSCDPWAGTLYSSAFNVSSDGISYIRYASNDSAGNVEYTNIYVVKKAENAPAPNWTRFENSLTTNMTEQGYTNITNFTIGVVNKSKIRFFDTIDLVDYNGTFNEVDLDSHVNCSDRLISVNSTALSMLNVSAELTFYNITFSEPQVHKDGSIFNSYNLSQSPNASNDYTMIINVSGFSTYEIVEGASDDSDDGDGGSLSGGSSGGGGSGTPTYNLSENNLLSGFTVVLSNNFKVRMPLLNETHLLTIDKILNDSIRITISSDPMTFLLQTGQTKKLDVNSDGVYDLSVFLKSISGLRANLVLTSISESYGQINKTSIIESNADTGKKHISSDDRTQTNDGSKSIFYAIAVIGILIVLILVAWSIWLWILKRHRSAKPPSSLIGS